ncbi:hypothetical protein CVT26_006564 [Gymnopilus dilepis]|uniref:DUF6699 domain-containing protein n=1 Tax=Gymnopilus dilepis TaxID=231916 RepID=A0A409Y2W2_9AGAR|nr:hypothetical protein CVT26_006564 [Gymnopilus dilepis]
MSATTYAASDDIRRRRVRFIDGDEVYGHTVVARSPSQSPPSSTPSPTMSHTTESSEGPSTPYFQTLPLPHAPPTNNLPWSRDIPLMSEELTASFQEPWRFFEQPRDRFWDTFNATANGLQQITLFVEGFPSPFLAEHPTSDKPVQIGDVYRAIAKYLRTAISENDEEYSGLTEQAKAKVMQNFFLRQSTNPNSVLERRDLLLERQVLKRIVPISNGTAWRVQFAET